MLFFEEPDDDRYCIMQVERDSPEGKAIVYAGGCPVHKLRVAIDKSPYFLKIYIKIADGFFFRFMPHERTAITKGILFRMYSMRGLGLLFSVNGEQVPFMSKEFIVTLVDSFKKNPQDFCQKAEAELEAVSPEWWKNFKESALESEIGKEGWIRVVFLLKVFMEGVKPLENLSDSDFDEIERFLEANRKSQ